MKIKKPFIFVYKLYTKFYLYDVNTKILVGISKNIVFQQSIHFIF